MGEHWIVVRNWSKFQHYSNREPVWIKLYLELRDSDEWGDLSWAQRGLLVSIWMEFGASRGILRASSLSQRCRQKTRKDTLDSLVSAGFIQLSASRPLALARSREVEVEVEEKKGEQAGARPHKPKPVDNPDPGRSNVLPKDPASAVEAMIRNRVITDPVDLTAEIAGYHLDDKTAARLRGLLQ
jgi:hypothetical protein